MSTTRIAAIIVAAGIVILGGVLVLAGVVNPNL